MTNEGIHVDDNLQNARELQLLRAGPHWFGIFADEIETTADWRPPTPLPNAPAGVLGIVCIRGRMLIALAAYALVDRQAPVTKASKIVALPGDEQVALAVDEVADTIAVNQDGLPPAAKDTLVIAKITVGDRFVTILNTNELFATVMRGHERRRRQF